MKRLNLPPLDHERIIVALTFAARGSIIGLCIFLSMHFGVAAGFRLDAVVYLVALIWCYVDGIAGRGRWGVAVAEAALLYLVSIQAGGLAFTTAMLLGHPGI